MLPCHLAQIFRSCKRLMLLPREICIADLLLIRAGPTEEAETVKSSPIDGYCRFLLLGSDSIDALWILKVAAVPARSDGWKNLPLVSGMSVDQFAGKKYLGCAAKGGGAFRTPSAPLPIATATCYIPPVADFGFSISHASSKLRTSAGTNEYEMKL